MSDEDDDETEASSSGMTFMVWRDHVSVIARLALRIAPLVGAAGFYVGLQMKIRGEPNGELVMGLGMFVAVQMLWGVNSIFEFLHKRKSALLRVPGHEVLFWIFIFVAFGIDFAIGMALDVANPLNYLPGG